MSDESPVEQHTFRLIAFDWDGTAVVDRHADATPVRTVIERLLRIGVEVAVITGTNFGNIDRQLSAQIHGPHKGRLHLLTNRGSEVWGFDDESRPIALYRRTASPDENRQLDAIAATVQSAITAHTGLEIDVIYDRLNRRKIDLIPLPQWRDPPKSEFEALYHAVQERLQGGGLERGLAAVFRLTERTALGCGLPTARITSDIKHIEVGLTDKSDSIDWIIRNLAMPQNISLDDILIGGDEFGPTAGFEGSDARMLTPAVRGATFVSVGPEPAGVPPNVLHLGGGPARFLALLEDQALHHERAPIGTRRQERVSIESALPLEPTHDRGWLLIEEGLNSAREREIESLFALGNGYIGSRGSLEEGGELSSPATFIAGVFEMETDFGSVPRLAVAPDWAHLTVSINGHTLALARGEVIEHRRILDLRQGILWRLWRQRDPDGRIISYQSLRLVSLADRHALFQAIAFTPENFMGRLALRTDPRAPAAGAPRTLMLQTKGGNVVAAFAVSEGLRPRCAETRRMLEIGDRTLESHDQEIDIELGQTYRFDRVVAATTSRDSDRPIEAATEHLQHLIGRGNAPLIADHLAAWRERWCTADLHLTGDEDAQRALRFACYHLIAASASDERASIGARALTGSAYSGHIFWDTEIYMLPFYLYTHPSTARTLLMYRYHTLPAARDKAHVYGYRGAFYPWESAADGTEATPERVLGLDGTVHAIRNGELEIHISAAVAYAVWQYWTTTGDDAFLREAGAEILIETARFWASRGRVEDDGHFHIRNVIGPDEYHQGVDDDAFTNGMAAWNLEHAARATKILAERWPGHWNELRSRLDLDPTEPDDWSRFAQSIYLGLDPATGIIEQFQGYHSLEEIDLASYEPRSAPMDVILGPDRIQQSQIIKQPDVLMLIYLLWDRFHPDIRRANFYYYDPRTGHGSSLSPCIHALLAARLGETELAERYFRQAAEIDLADNMGNAAGGVHIGALGGLWQAAVFGFGGLRIGPEGPTFEPRLPCEWRELHFPIRWRGSTLHVVVDAAGATIHPGEPTYPGDSSHPGGPTHLGEAAEPVE